MSDETEHDDPRVTRADVDAAASRLLARRDHARGELEDKLRRRDMPNELIDDVLDDFDERGYLDDRQFAVEQGSILARKCWGPRQIAAKLRKRGVSDEVIERALADIEQHEDWSRRARERLVSRFSPPDELDDDDQQRAYRHLTYRGYSPSLVRRLLFDG